ncbi:hypothetical protein IWQ62_004029 [Dispira parvispora]|uniref:5-hydroxyisourate hydrolase n=1 Tax=Dispira parvispora TaxID=1520584 RepID=A0A9W8E5S5_9FUNG|nr:hypothetical protein IWQ62_004029 [Dispira parvispora]
MASGMRSPITSHVLDAQRGQPAQGVRVELKRENPSTQSWDFVSTDTTNKDGRAVALLPPGSQVEPGLYVMRFYTQAYFTELDQKSFYPFVEVHFCVDQPSDHYHIPLLLSSHSYTTYRGS